MIERWFYNEEPVESTCSYYGLIAEIATIAQMGQRYGGFTFTNK